MLSRIKKNDLVSVVSGKDKGKEGRVVDMDPKKDRALVKGVAIITRHAKAKKQGEKSGIIKEESYVSLCKVMPVCPSCKKPCRTQTKEMEDGKKARVCHRCKEQF